MGKTRGQQLRTFAMRLGPPARRTPHFEELMVQEEHTDETNLLLCPSLPSRPRLAPVRRVSRPSRAARAVDLWPCRPMFPATTAFRVPDELLTECEARRFAT